MQEAERKLTEVDEFGILLNNEGRWRTSSMPQLAIF